jgi:hypothetical protein
MTDTEETLPEMSDHKKQLWEHNERVTALMENKRAAKELAQEIARDDLLVALKKALPALGRDGIEKLVAQLPTKRRPSLGDYWTWRSPNGTGVEILIESIDRDGCVRFSTEVPCPELEQVTAVYDKGQVKSVRPKGHPVGGLYAVHIEWEFWDDCQYSR